MPVQVQVAQSVRIPDTTEYLSVLKSRQSAVINPQVEGQITKIFVKSGDLVNAGTPLLQIDPLKQEATLKQPGGDAGIAGGQSAASEDFAGAGAKALRGRSYQQTGF